MARGRIAYLIHSLDDGVECRVVAYGAIRTSEVVINSSREAHDGDVVLLGKDTRTAERAVATDDNEGIDTLGTHIIVGLPAPLGRDKLLAACRLKDGTTLLYDITHGLRIKLLHLVIHQAVITALDAHNPKAVIYRCACHGPNRRIHPRSITSRGEHSNTLYLCHSSESVFSVKILKIYHTPKNVGLQHYCNPTIVSQKQSIRSRPRHEDP